jgi:hypothetical protein
VFYLRIVVSHTLGALRGDLEVGLLYWEGTLKATYDIPKKAFEMEHLPPHSGSARGTWREGSFTENP